jgi:alkanesulfonate monooxygenase SsuD/methylene tetrahydromethanopterin reductase-like flavin-dependent oxidoreductase (luciferase family)
MKFGLRYCNTGRYTDPGQAVELMQAGEAAGFESAWTVEHTVIPPRLSVGVCLYIRRTAAGRRGRLSAA